MGKAVYICDMRVILLGFLLSWPFMAMADVVSKGFVTEYVSQQNETKVDTSVSSVQTMAGNYTVSGSFKVPTPPLPAPE